MKKLIKISLTTIIFSVLCITAVGCESYENPAEGWNHETCIKDKIWPYESIDADFETYNDVENYYYENPRNCGTFIFEYDDSIVDRWLDGRQVYEVYKVFYGQSQRGTEGYYLTERFVIYRMNPVFNRYLKDCFLDVYIVPLVQEYSGQELTLEFKKDNEGAIKEGRIDVFVGKELAATFYCGLFGWKGVEDSILADWLGEYILKNLKWLDADKI